jgi:transcriptional regulator with XRE-family HTH domain
MKTEQTESLGNLLLKCRTARDLSLEDVARALKLSLGAISMIERGKSKPRRTTRAKLEAFLAKYGYLPKGKAAA